MSARIPPGFAEVWIRWNSTVDPEPMFCAIGVDLAAGVGATATVTNLLDQTVNLAMDGATSSDLTLGPGHTIYGQDGGDIRIDSANAPIAGVLGANALPANCAVLTRKLTASGGRRGRGRMYSPGIPETSVGFAGTYAAGVQATLQTALDLLRTNLIALAEVEDVVLFHDSAPFTPTPITSLEVQPKIATQRRRMRP